MPLLFSSSLLGSNLCLSVMGFSLVNPRSKFILLSIPWAKLIRSLTLRVCFTGVVLLLGGGLLCSNLCLGVVRLPLAMSLLFGGSFLGSNLGFSMVRLTLIDPGSKLVYLRVPRTKLVRLGSLGIAFVVSLLFCSSFFSGDLGLSVVASLQSWDYGTGKLGS